MLIEFHQTGSLALETLKYVVIVARYQNQWMIVRHHERETWEVPGGHRESGEAVDLAARRELYEATEALEFNLLPVCEYLRNLYEKMGFFLKGKANVNGREFALYEMQVDC